jgi:hypothetical protein
MPIDQGGPRVTRAGLLWAACAILVATALGWQALYQLGIRECRENSDDRLMLCSGPLDAWVLPLTLAAALLMALAGAWRVYQRRSDSDTRS